MHISFLTYVINVIFKHGYNLDEISKHKIAIKSSPKKCCVSTEVTFKGLANVVVMDRKILGRKPTVNRIYQNF